MVAPQSTGVRHGDDQGFSIVVPGKLVAGAHIHKEKEMQTDKILVLAEQCADAIRWRTQEIPHLQAALDELNGNTCTGWEIWRDKNHPTKSPKLYIFHGTGDTCPIHGAAKNGGRLRTYVGCDPDNIAAARAAIARYAEKQDLEARLQKLRYGLSTCSYHLDKFFASLDYTVKDDGTIE